MQAVSSPAFHLEIHILFFVQGLLEHGCQQPLCRQMFFFIMRLEHRVNSRNFKFAFSVLYKQPPKL